LESMFQMFRFLGFKNQIFKVLRFLGFENQIRKLYKLTGNGDFIILEIKVSGIPSISFHFIYSFQNILKPRELF
jgi:hypothetical protein